MPQPPRHRQIAAKRHIYIVQYLDKATWRDCNKEFHDAEYLAYNQQNEIRILSSEEKRYRIRTFVEKE
jgi:hypothetical protein